MDGIFQHYSEYGQRDEFPTSGYTPAGGSGPRLSMEGKENKFYKNKIAIRKQQFQIMVQIPVGSPGPRAGCTRPTINGRSRWCSHIRSSWDIGGCLFQMG